MDFTLDEAQQAIVDLTSAILGDRLPPERLRAIETDDDRWFAADVWAELARADLLGLSLPDDVGGGGMTFLETCLVLEQQGRTVAPLPLVPTLVLGALPIARFGTPAQRERWLPGVISGETILSAALVEEGTGLAADAPATVARAERVHGEKRLVPAAHLAAGVLVPTDEGVYIVEPTDDGVELERNEAITGEPLWTMRLDGARGERLGTEASAEVVGWIEQRAVAAQCALMTGVCDGALRLAAAYVSEREQFGSKIGTFQAVAQRLADAYVDTEGIRLTALQAAWRLAVGLPADEELHIAKFWAADGGHRVVHACQHVHGGIGVDLDYPVHRYFRWAKVLELSLGSAVEHLRRLGATLAAEPA
jgi:alkylation response protein AidB-like acyl-CoA dehydrogenase